MKQLGDGGGFMLSVIDAVRNRQLIHFWRIRPRENALFDE